MPPLMSGAFIFLAIFALGVAVVVPSGRRPLTLEELVTGKKHEEPDFGFGFDWETLGRSALEYLSNRQVRLATQKTTEQIEELLVIAGEPYGINSVRRYNGIKTSFLSVGLIAALVGGFLLGQQGVLPGIAIMAVAYIGMDRWLRAVARNRQEHARRDVIDFADQLSVVLAAGLTVAQGLERVSEEIGGPLGEEFLQARAEMRAGKPREDALRDAAKRLRVEEVQSFVDTLIQSERYGTGIARNLKAYADHSRELRLKSAEEQAKKAATKMFLPIAIFIFPALMIFIGYPAMSSFGGSL